MQRTFVVLVAFACAWLWACGAESDHPLFVSGTDSVTEFLKCNEDKQCPGVGESCFCGTCTLQCETFSDCGGGEQRCHIASEVCGEVPMQSGAVGLCTAGCETDSDCAERGTLSRCVGQRCVAGTAMRGASLEGVEGAGGTAAPDASPAAAPEPVACEDDTQRCGETQCEPGFEAEEISLGCCRCALVDPCAGGEPMVGTPAVLAGVLSERLLGTVASDAFVERVSSLQHTGELRCLVEEMVEQPEAEPGVRAFFRSWLGLEALDSSDWLTLEVRLAMIESSLLFARDVVRSGGGLSELLTSRDVWTSGDLHDIYQTQSSRPLSPTEDFVKVTLSDANRSGVLSQAAFVASHAGGADSTSPVKRGAAVLEGLLCSVVPSPPPVVPSIDPVPAGSTTRQRLATHVDNPACAGCHALIDPYGFGLENFDPSGRYRETENDIPLDVSMQIVASDFAGAYAGPREFFTAAAESAQVQDCFSQRWGTYLVTGNALAEDTLNIAESVGEGVRNTLNPTLASFVGIAASSAPFLAWVNAGARTEPEPPGR